MKVTRAKFGCTSVETFPQSNPSRVYRFTAFYDPDVPEDERYARYTPSGSLTIQVDNPAVTFEPGRAYYLDFSPVEE
jgi:hypothetical protein